MTHKAKTSGSKQAYADYRDALKVIDSIFGGYNMLVMVPLAFYHQWHEVLHLLLFLLFNMAISIVGTRREEFLSTSRTKAMRIELLRHLLGAPLAVFIYVETGWWQGILVLTLGGTMQLGILLRRPNVGRWLVLTYASLFAISAAAMGNSVQDIPMMTLLSFLMIGFTFVEINTYLGRIILEIRRNNKVMNAANLRLERVNEDMERIVHVVAHDIRGPLARIEGLTNVLNYSNADSERKEIVERITDSAHHGLEIADYILSVNGDQSAILQPERVEIVEIIKDNVLTDFQEQIAKKGITVHVKYAESVELVVPKKMLRRILDNLVSNAIKYSPINGEIVIKVLKDGGSVTLAVSDYGAGFSEDDKMKVFKKFMKLSARPTAGESSNGLGLYIVHQLVVQLNGTITLESEEGKGSTFIVRFAVAS